MNIIIDNQYIKPYDKVTLFEEEEVLYLSDKLDLTDLVVELGLFSSKSQSRKSNRIGEVTKWWNVIKGNKKTPLYIWNPTE